MRMKKVIGVTFVACLSVGCIVASDPMVQNAGEEAFSEPTEIITKSIRPVNKHGKARRPITISADYGLPDSDSDHSKKKTRGLYDEHFSDDDAKSADFHSRIFPLLTKPSEASKNQKDEYEEPTVDDNE